jgi:hypothetical protein
MYGENETKDSQTPMRKMKIQNNKKYLFLVSIGVGFGLSDSCLQSRHSTSWATPLLHFSQAILEMQYHDLFVWTDLKPPFSHSQALN